MTRRMMGERRPPRGIVGLMDGFRRPAVAAPPIAASATRDAPTGSAGTFTVQPQTFRKTWSLRWTQPDGTEWRLMSIHHDAVRVVEELARTDQIDDTESSQ